MALSTHDQKALVGVHPLLIEKVGNVIAAMAAAGHPMLITAGVRTQAQQQALYAQGRTAPGHIVTRADGVRNKSNHQVKADGYGHAVDCAFVINGLPSWDVRAPWAAYGALVAAQGLTWGGAWPAPQLHDLPHAELL